MLRVGMPKEEEGDVDVEEEVIMLRRATDPKTRRKTLCEPAHATCARTFHKSRFVQ